MFPIGLAIAVYRRKFGMSAAEAAKRLGVSRGFLSTLETGHRLPPVSLDFVDSTAEFLKIADNTVLASVTCEHFLAAVKNLKWLPGMVASAVSRGFKRYYLFPETRTREVHVLAPADKFRHLLVSKLVSRYLDRIAGNYIEHPDGIIPFSMGKTQVSSLGIIKNPKPYLFQSDSLFPARESIVFLDSLGIDDYLLFNLSFHTPQTGMDITGSLCETSITLSPYRDPGISFLDLPITRSKRDADKKP